MKKRGVKVLDPVTETKQIDWLIISVAECRTRDAEERLVAAHFRRPHEPWGGDLAYVAPVEIRRSRRRILFLQHSGLQP